MNQLKNGTLLVAIATVITVILILMTVRDGTNTSTQKEIAIIENTSSLQSAETNATEDNEVKKVIDQTVESSLEAAQEHIQPAVENEKPAAPEGPFHKFQVKTDESDKTNNLDSSVTKISKQHDLLNHITQPIWMDQKLGDFKSVENGEVVFKLMPSNPDGLQGENPKSVITNKSDKFAPTSIPANYNYQQMPMYNGGYYIAPMPSYLMPSMLPGNATIKSGKKAKSKN